jgi:uncharacterized short protein YbdD (DUF466 family)
MLADALRRSWQSIVHAARTISGVPDYEAWLEHAAATGAAADGASLK